jgi:hypothetical protein
VLAQLLRGDEIVQEVPLPFAGQTSMYSGKLTAQEPGAYTVQVLASDPSHVNFGWVREEVTVR